MAAPFADALTDETLATLRQAGTLQHFPSRAWVLATGADSGNVLFIESGLLRVERPTSSGRTVLLELAAEGSTVGELGAITGAPRSASVITIEPSSVLSVGVSAFDELMLRADFSRYIAQTLAERIIALTGQLIEASDRSATARVAARLVELLGRSDQRDAPTPVLQLPISQQELGQWAGLSREGTAKALRELRESGTIRTGRLEITIEDPAALRTLARTAGSIH